MGPLTSATATSSRATNGPTAPLPGGLLIQWAHKGIEGVTLIGHATCDPTGWGCCADDEIPRAATILAYVDLRPIIEALKSIAPGAGHG